MKFRHLSIAVAAALAWSSPVLANDTVVLHVNIVEQSLSSALGEFATQAKLQLIADAELLKGKKAPKLQGHYTLKEALDALLKNSSLEAVSENDKVIIRSISSSNKDILEAISITASADASAEGLMPTFNGGQVARGGKVGILGNKDMMETPFTITAYTNELIQDQQTNSVKDVLLNDPSNRSAVGYGNFQEAYFVRGQILFSDSVAYNGLYGLLPRQYISSELLERVEVLRGASTFLLGSTPSGDGLGGAINLLPKRAPNEPLARVTFGTENGETLNTALDVAHRFGEDKNTGVRFVVQHKEGGNGVDREDETLDLVMLGWDYRGESFRLSADLGYQNRRLKETRPSLFISGITQIPFAPDGSHNWAQPWTHSDEKDIFGSFRGEYDFSQNVTGWVASGFKKAEEDNSVATLTMTNNNGDGHIYRFDNVREDTIFTAETGLRAKTYTKEVSHDIVFSANYFESHEKNAYTWHSNRASNLYNPTFYALYDDVLYSGGDLNDPKDLGRTRLMSYALGDTLGFFDEKLLVTLGARYQEIDLKEYYYGPLISMYKEEHISPLVGIVYKLSPEISIYANYVQGLSQGELAPWYAANSGSRLDPYVTEQLETGIKYDAKTLGATLALFSTTKPRGITNVSNVFVEEGENRYKGAELSAYGEVTEGLKLLGGFILLDTEQTKTGNASTEGKRVIGVPEVQANIGFDWRVPGVEGLSLDTRLIYTAEVYADSANTLKVPSWERVDVGAKYQMLWDKRLVTYRARVLNVADSNYWASSGGYPDQGYLVLSTPRTFMLNVSMDF